jgi:hypothetical protein
MLLGSFYLRLILSRNWRFTLISAKRELFDPLPNSSTYLRKTLEKSHSSAFMRYLPEMIRYLEGKSIDNDALRPEEFDFGEDPS